MIVLSGGKFDEVLAAHSTLLVGFFAPWCTHCNQMAQAWEGAASSLLNSTPPVRVASVNGAVETKLARRSGAQQQSFSIVSVYHRFRHQCSGMDSLGCYGDFIVYGVGPANLSLPS